MILIAAVQLLTALIISLLKLIVVKRLKRKVEQAVAVYVAKEEERYAELEKQQRGAPLVKKKSTLDTQRIIVHERSLEKAKGMKQ